MIKKVCVFLAALFISAGIAAAQDLATATETYNNGAEQLSIGDKVSALAAFKEALQMGEGIGDEAAELVANCKKVIPGVALSIGKESFNNKKFANAIAQFKEAEELAKKYENDDVITEVAALIAQAELQGTLQDANNAFNAKDFAAAAEGFKKVIATDSTHKNASIRLVQSLANLNDFDGAKAALEIATANGQEANAVKAIAGAYLKEAAAALKGGKFADVIKLINDADEGGFINNPQAYQLAGQAATKLNKDADAIKYFEKYLDGAPTAKNAGQIALTIGALYQKLKNNDKAIEFYKKAVAAGQADAQKYIDALSK